MPENNLTELNKILFETLRGVEKGSISNEKSQAITNVSNSIINNAKTQLNAFKLTKGVAFKDTFGGIPKITLKSGDIYEQKSEFALSRSFKNVSEAITEMGKSNFENQFKSWVKK
jgi:hypothetical protein